MSKEGESQRDVEIAPTRRRQAAPAISDIPAFVKVRERPLKTHLLGRGATVFVCPVGWGVPGEMVLNVLRNYGELARFLTFDPSGTGESTSIRTKEDLSSRGVANDVSGMLLRLKLRPAAIFGHSHGGAVALRVAIAHQELVRRLVVVSTSPGGLGEGPWNWTRILGDLTPREPLKTREEFLRIARRLFVNSLAEPARANEAFAGAVAKEWSVSIDRFNAMEKEFKTYDLRGKMRHIQAPTLIAAGKLDPVVPLEAAEAIRAEIPKSELVVFERSGHYPMLEEPAKFKSVIEEFLKRD